MGRVVRVVGAAVAVAISIILLVTQIEVTDAESGVTRTCGSTLDAAVDRSGWEHWWAQDLDESEERVRSELLRTTSCPDAINTRSVWVVGLGVFGCTLMLFARPPRPRSRIGHDELGSLGTAVVVVGSALTAAGVVAIVVLIADADSTLFLYVDRLVVAIIGLIVLVPTISLVVLGRVLRVVSERLTQEFPDDGS